MLEGFKETSNDFLDRGEKYLDASKRYFKLKIFQQVSLSVNILSLILLIGGSVFIGIIFMSVALAIYIGNALDSIPLGYIIVGAVFFITAVVFFLLRKRIEDVVISKVSDTFFD